MTKEQAQIYINNVGQANKHFTKAPYFGYLFIALVFLSAAVGFCHTLPMVIVVCVLSVLGIVFTFVAVKKYMSFLRASVVYAVYILLWTLAFDCIAHAIKFYDGSFVVWEYCLCIVIQVLTFAVSVTVCFVFANRAKPKKIAAAAVGCTASVALAGASFARYFSNRFEMSSDTALLVMTVILNILACLCMIMVAVFFVRIIIMRKYGVVYQPEKLEVCGVRKLIESQRNDTFTTVYGFAYDRYTFYIYAKRDNYRIDVYDGKTRISRKEYEKLESLFDSEKINDKKLAKIWHCVQPI